MKDGYALELKGLAPYLPRKSRVPVKEWAVPGGRPGNHPMRRVIGAAHLMDRFVESGLLTGQVGAVAEGRAVVLLRLLRVAPHIGDGQALEIAVNAALPFLYAWAGFRRDRRLKESSLDLLSAVSEAAR